MKKTQIAVSGTFVVEFDGTVADYEFQRDKLLTGIHGASLSVDEDDLDEQVPYAEEWVEE